MPSNNSERKQVFRENCTKEFFELANVQCRLIIGKPYAVDLSLKICKLFIQKFNQKLKKPKKALK